MLLVTYSEFDFLRGYSLISSDSQCNPDYVFSGLGSLEPKCFFDGCYRVGLSKRETGAAF